jgi:hypothetical protein
VEVVAGGLVAAECVFGQAVQVHPDAKVLVVAPSGEVGREGVEREADAVE